MANTTIADVLNATRQATLPQFVSPPIFHPGKTCASEFIKAYERSALANGWDDSLKIAYFETFLDGAANIWFQKYKTEKQNSVWADIDEDFRMEFEDIGFTEERRKRVEKKKQQKEESVVSYLYELQVLYHNYKSEMDIEEFIQFVSKGLTEENYYHYYWLTSPPNKPPDSLDQLKRIAVTIDRAPRRTEAPESRVPSAPPTPQQTNHYNYGISDRRPQNTGYRNQGNNWQSPPNYRCQQPERRYQQLPEQPRTMRPRNVNNNPRCYNCGRTGHFAASCRMQHPNARGWQN
jgi:hypothetical protein